MFEEWNTFDLLRSLLFYYNQVLSKAILNEILAIRLVNSVLMVPSRQQRMH